MAKVTSYAYVNPVVAVLLGIFLLHERPQAEEFAGMAGIVVAVFLLTTSQVQARSRELPPHWSSWSRCRRNETLPCLPAYDGLFGKALAGTSAVAGSPSSETAPCSNACKLASSAAIAIQHAAPFSSTVQTISNVY